MDVGILVNELQNFNIGVKKFDFRNVIKLTGNPPGL